MKKIIYLLSLFFTFIGSFINGEKTIQEFHYYLDLLNTPAYSFIQKKTEPLYQHHFVVIVPSYNNNKTIKNELLYKKNLDSILNQNYHNYRVIYIDDNSTDGTAQAVIDYLKTTNQTSKVTLIANTERKGALYNRYHAVHSCQDYEIIVMVDGDDCLADNNVLSFLNNVYQDPNIWITYGNHRKWCQNCITVSAPLYYQYSEKCFHTKDQGFCAPLPPEHFITENKWREYVVYHRPKNTDWVFGALPSFYAGLFKKIRKEDLMVNGKFYARGTDPAITFPMVEMAGIHVRFIPNILYIYNIQRYEYGNQHVIQEIKERGDVFWFKEIAASLNQKYTPLTTLACVPQELTGA